MRTARSPELDPLALSLSWSEPSTTADKLSVPPYVSVPVRHFRRYPFRTNGKVFYRVPGSGRFRCSATAVKAQNRSLVIAAAHCLKFPHERWAKDWMFIPAYSRRGSRFGGWVWDFMRVPYAWVTRFNPNFDAGAVIVRPRNGHRLEDVVGGRQISFGERRRQRYHAFGYAQNKRSGQRMWICLSRSAVKAPGYGYPGPRGIGIGCDQGDGASGGGWIAQDGSLVSVASHTDFLRRYPNDLLFGTYFGRAIHRLYRSTSRREPSAR